MFYFHRRSRFNMECSVCATHHGSDETTCNYCGSSLVEKVHFSLRSEKDNTPYHQERVRFGLRSLANLTDMVLLFLATLPSILHFFEMGKWEFLPQTIFLLSMLFLFQIFLLIHDHQTIGKKITGIAIVDSKTGDIPSPLRLVIVRHCIPWALYLVPILRFFILAVNLFLFVIARGRGLHDVLSNTKVARA